jgi:hypothetical protein
MQLVDFAGYPNVTLLAPDRHEGSSEEPIHGGGHMTWSKATALTAALAGAVAVGVWIGPILTDRAKGITHRTEAPAVVAASPKPEIAKTPAPPPGATAARSDTRGPKAAMIAVSAPKLHKRLRPLLKSGADMAIVSEGFRNAEDFAATVHASKNTNVPFMILKHEVVDEGKSLSAAIREAKPGANASLEADLARAEARSDLASLN